LTSTLAAGLESYLPVAGATLPAGAEDPPTAKNLVTSCPSKALVKAFKNFSST
jgi:hypothetical protein